jgi:hypothetical protein
MIVRNKLLEQLYLVNAYEHLCPKCDGSGCYNCDKGYVDNPVVEKLVEIIHIFVERQLAVKNFFSHWEECSSCNSLDVDCCDEGRDLKKKMFDCDDKVNDLIRKGSTSLSELGGGI